MAPTRTATTRLEPIGEEEEASRLKTIAEDKYRRSKLKSALKYAKRAQRLCPNLDGISDMVTAFKILYVYSKSSSSSSSNTAPDWYQILEVEPFSHINSIKKHYKKLALILHPDKNTCIASEEAFKRVSEAHQILSDKIRRKEYDLKLLIALQSQATITTPHESTVLETFWTACSRCSLYHQFDRRYIGQYLRCPTCKMSFFAQEVTMVQDDQDMVEQKNARVRTKASGLGGSTVETEPVKRSSRISVKRKFYDIEDFIDPLQENSRLNFRPRYRKVEPELTLAQMQLAAKRKSLQEKAKKAADKMHTKEKEDKNKDDKVRAREKEKEKIDKEKKRGMVENLEKKRDVEVMPVEDSDFYDFDKDRTARCFKKAQIWAIYDDNDGMPRHYALIDEVESVSPFVAKISWLDMESNGDERLICWEKSGFHISCGRFKVSRKIVVDSVNVFSHLVQCERVAREIYWIYPRKGSIWALYNEKCLNGDDGNQMLVEATRSYNIVVSLTTYSEMHGLSMAYLEKVSGFKTIFKRREIGLHAIKWLEKEDFRLFSHQIPAKKFTGTEACELPRDCWELDPASLPPDMLSIGWER